MVVRWALDTLAVQRALHNPDSLSPHYHSPDHRERRRRREESVNEEEGEERGKGKKEKEGGGGREGEGRKNMCILIGHARHLV